jgi:hypothetical protein
MGSQVFTGTAKPRSGLLTWLPVRAAGRRGWRSNIHRWCRSYSGRLCWRLLGERGAGKGAKSDCGKYIGIHGYWSFAFTS